MRQGGRCWKRLLDQENVELCEPVIDPVSSRGVSIGRQACLLIDIESSVHKGKGTVMDQYAVELGRSRKGGGRCNGSLLVDVVDLYLVGTTTVIRGLRLIRTAVLRVAGLGHRLAATEVDQGRYTGSSGRKDSQGEEGQDGSEKCHETNLTDLRSIWCFSVL